MSQTMAVMNSTDDYYVESLKNVLNRILKVVTGREETYSCDVARSTADLDCSKIIENPQKVLK